MEIATPHGSRRIKGHLVNISRSGALIDAGNPPPRGTPILLRIDWPVRTDWVDAIVVRDDPESRVGVRFTRACADDLLLAAAVGIDLASLVRGGPNLSTAFD
jgi:hypothetical protein